MAVDAYGRPIVEETGYFESSYAPKPNFNHASGQHTAEPYDSYSSSQRNSSVPQQPDSRNMSVPERSESSHDGPAGHDVSPELIAAITERVKKEVMEHMKQAAATLDDPSKPPLHRNTSSKSSSTSSPTPVAGRVHTPPSPAHPSKTAYAMPKATEPVKSQPTSTFEPSNPLDKPSGVRFSDRSVPRPAGGSRTYSTLELSTIDQKWGRLFDSEANPTKRLGEFLRGLANHMIEEFMPKRSIVVLPTKMANLYATHALDKESQPYVSIFRAQSNEQISKIYQDLGCEHHFVQETVSTAPVVPALTPSGFAHWMSLHIMAYPEQEAKRLENIVQAMPIDADGDKVDGKPERLPKQISRHLLPEVEDKASKKLIETALSNFFEDIGNTNRRKPSITPPPPLSRHSSTSNRARPAVPVEIHQTKTSPPSKSQPIERERNPYSGAPSASDTSSNEDIGVKIERDRQPYTAQPGSGKVYEGATSNTGTRPGRANSTSQRRDIPEARVPAETRHHRTQSTASQNYVPPVRTSRRTSSPPFKSYSNSTPDDLGGYKYAPPSTTSSIPHQGQPFTPSAYGTSSSIPPPPPIDVRDTRDKRARDERLYRDETRVAGDFNSPRDAERWDRLQEGTYETRDPREHRNSIPDHRDSRGPGYEDYYRTGYENEKRY